MQAEPRDVHAHVERIVNSPMFAESERLRRFLRFTVESKLRGDGERLKEYVLGREVFDRTDGYDPRLDPIVRVEARRLRSKLSEYYSGPGKSEPMRIEYPKGTYLPVFADAGVANSSKPRRRYGVPIVVLAASAALSALGANGYRTALADRPAAIAVMPAQWLWRNDEGQESAAIGFAEALAAELANRHLARVVAWPLIVQQHAAATSIADAAKRLGTSRFIAVGARPLQGGDLITVFLMNATTGEKLRAQHYFVKNAASYWVQSGLATQIADDLHSSGNL